MTFVLLSISSTCGFVCRSRWIWGLDKMCCLVSWGLEVERVLCRNGLPATQCIIPVSASSRLSIWCWSAGKKPGSLFIRPWWLSRPSTVEIRSEQDRKNKDGKLLWLEYEMQVRCEKRLTTSGGEVSSCVLQFLPRQRCEVEDGRLSRSELRRTVSSDWTISGAGSLAGAADEGGGLTRMDWI